MNEGPDASPYCTILVCTIYTCTILVCTLLHNISMYHSSILKAARTFNRFFMLKTVESCSLRSWSCIATSDACIPSAATRGLRFWKTWCLENFAALRTLQPTDLVYTHVCTHVCTHFCTHLCTHVCTQLCGSLMGYVMVCRPAVALWLLCSPVCSFGLLHISMLLHTYNTTILQ